MTALRQIAGLRRFARSEAGTTLVELAVVLPLFLLLFFSVIDFGRFGFAYMMAEKANAIAARIAVVRPPACPGVPTQNLAASVPAGTLPPKFGTNCRAGAAICVSPATVSCAGNAANPTVAEIWSAVSVLMPPGATPSNLNFSYAYTSDLGFLGGPYVPIVTVKITGTNFNFATPLAALAGLAGAPAGQRPPMSLPFPPMSVALPAEDLAEGGG